MWIMSVQLERRRLVAIGQVAELKAMVSWGHPSASSAVSPSLGSSAIVSTTPDDPIGSMLITYLFAMGRLPPFVVDSARNLNKRPGSTRDEPTNGRARRPLSAFVICGRDAGPNAKVASGPASRGV